ncbi:MAG: MarR family transcriptional regulator [Erythrobacter sp.]
MKLDDPSAERCMADSLTEAGELDFGKGSDLSPFADQLMAIARQLRDGEFVPPFEASVISSNKESTKTASQTNRDQFLALAKRIYAIRRRRSSIFGNPDLFGEPAWDILLDLYIAHVEQKPVSVSSACIGSASPSTTALRWLGVLAEDDLIIREQDRDDQRRVLVRLTERGVEAMETYFAKAAGS